MSRPTAVPVGSMFTTPFECSARKSGVAGPEAPASARLVSVELRKYEAGLTASCVRGFACFESIGEPLEWAGENGARFGHAKLFLITIEVAGSNERSNRDVVVGELLSVDQVTNAVKASKLTCEGVYT